MLSKPTIKYIQSLQHKKFRDELNAFVAEGPKLVKELLHEGIFPCKAVYALEDWINNLDAETLKEAGERLIPIKDFELEKIASYTTPNNVLAIFEKRAVLDDIKTADTITLALDDIRDPGNFGTIIRTADWFGIKNIVCSDNTVDMYNSKTVQSTMASLARVNIMYTDLSSWLSSQKPRKIATTLQGKPLKDFRNTNEAILVIGNEANGITTPVLEQCDERLNIPRIGSAESLNAAVATGIILHALKNL